MPQPLNMSAAKRRSTVAGKCASLMIPEAMQWPMFDETAATDDELFALAAGVAQPEPLIADFFAGL